MPSLSRSLAAILTVFWMGGLWVTGLLVAPILFHELDSATAGRVAGVMFRMMAWVGMVAGVYLILQSFIEHGFAAFKQTVFWLLLAMLGLTLLNHFLIFPVIADLKNQLHHAAEGVFGGGFQSWHTLSSLVYLIQALFALVYISRQETRR
ncbi:DUF4149 domain-containing protein [Burkholderiaceae bacterium DAT-1]|nr:DUF4149 domain-containing protein [Burkholderiaceae bacterium DAT-1]